MNINKKYDIFIFLIIVYCIILYIKPITKEIKKYKFKTGDIILTNTFDILYLKLLTKYTHTSLIICIFDKVYVLDAYPDEDIRLITLDEFMKTCDTIYIMSLKDKFSKEIEYKLFKNIKYYLNFKYPKFKFIYLIKNYIKSYLYSNNEKIPTYISCSEFIYYIFENIGFLKDTYYLKTPDDILKLNTHKFLGYYSRYDD
jgi:hypothetical protein